MCASYLLLEQPEDSRAEGAADVTLSGERVVQEPYLQRDESIFPQVDTLGERVVLPVPDVNVLSVQPYV